MNKTVFIIAISILIVLIAASTFLYVIPETEQVVITQFGKPKRVVTEAGLHVKTPILEQVNTFEKRILEWDGKPTQVPTLDKRYIWVDSFARWRITDPLKFFQRIRNETSAHALLDDIINSEVRNQISNQLLIDAISQNADRHGPFAKKGPNGTHLLTSRRQNTSPSKRTPLSAMIDS